MSASRSPSPRRRDCRVSAVTSRRRRGPNSFSCTMDTVCLQYGGMCVFLSQLVSLCVHRLTRTSFCVAYHQRCYSISLLAENTISYPLLPQTPTQLDPLTSIAIHNKHTIHSTPNNVTAGLRSNMEPFRPKPPHPCIRVSATESASVLPSPTALAARTLAIPPT